MSEQLKSGRERRWWLKMLVASVALAGFLAVLAWAAPALACARHSLAYRFRVASGKPLERAVSYLEGNRVRAGTVRYLLGAPDAVGGGEWDVCYLLYLYNDFRPYVFTNSNVDFDVGLVLRCRDGEPMSVMPMNLWAWYGTADVDKDGTPDMEFIEEEDFLSAPPGLALQDSSGGVSRPPVFRPRK